MSDIVDRVGSLFTKRFVDESGFSCTQRGGNPDCEHARTKDTGRGTVCFFLECLDCGAHITVSCGDDPFLQAAESALE